MHIRDYTPDDYDAVAAIYTATTPGHAIMGDDLRQADTIPDPKYKMVRWVAERDGRVVGTALYWQPPLFYDPHRFTLDVAVLPEVQGHGIGKALFTQVIAALEPFNPHELICQMREHPSPDRPPRALRFLEDRGFTEMGQLWESTLDVPTFDFTPHRTIFERLAREGIRILSLVELIHDPIRYRHVYELEMVLSREVPTGNPITLDFDTWIQETLANPQLIPEAYLLAMHAGGYVALSTLWGSPGDTIWVNKLTAVKTEYRRRGIALALKIRGIGVAQKHGIQTITTWNMSGNDPILALNDDLGFVRQPGIVYFRKRLKL